MTDALPEPHAGFFPLPTLGVLAIDGADAAAFLQGQATCDCRQLDATHAALGALCNLQGRMIVSFYVFAVDGGLRLLMPRDRVAAVLTHLKKYAVFAKVTLRDDSDAGALAACVTDDPAALPFSITAEDDGAWCIHLRGARALRWTQPAHSPTATDTAGVSAWRAASIRAGELLIDTASADAFLPQALNYDVIDGVNFRKGCYTGQEVVARMHFKGRMKERLYVLQATGTVPAPGSALQDGDGHEVGRVLDAVTTRDGCVIAAVVRHDALARGVIMTADKAPLVRLPAPYATPDAPP
jgi:folate-binding protein YgfZ